MVYVHWFQFKYYVYKSCIWNNVQNQGGSVLHSYILWVPCLSLKMIIHKLKLKVILCIFIPYSTSHLVEGWRLSKGWRFKSNGELLTEDWHPVQVHQQFLLVVARGHLQDKGHPWHTLPSSLLSYCHYSVQVSELGVTLLLNIMACQVM